MSALLAELLPYVLVFFLADGLTVVRLWQTLLVSAAGGHRLEGAGLHLLGLLPWTEVVAVDQDPVLLLSSGLGAFRNQGRYAPRLIEPDDVEVVPWSSVGDVQASGRRVFSGGRLLCVATTRASAREIAARIEAVRGAPPEQRSRVIERLLETATDLESLREVRQRTRALRTGLAVASALVFALVFLLLPVALYTTLQRHLPLEPILLAIAACAIAAGALGTALVLRSGVREEVAQEVMPLLLFPPGAARALAQLSRGLFSKYDLAALTAVLLPREQFIACARQELNRIRLGRERVLGTDVDSWYLARQRAWRKVVRGAGLDLDEILAPPLPSHEDSRSYCPLCSGEYRVGFQSCSECGVALAPFGGPR